MPGGGKAYEGIYYCHPNPTVWKGGKVKLAKTKAEYDTYYSTRKNSTVEGFIKTLPSSKIPKKSFRFGPEKPSSSKGYSSTGYSSVISSSPQDAEEIMRTLKKAKETSSVSISFDAIVELADGNKAFINPRYSYTQEDEKFVNNFCDLLESKTDIDKYDDPTFFKKTEKMFGLKF